MKVVFVGGGALRHLSTLRAALAEQAIFQDGEICLYDLDRARAEAMGRMVMKTPEYAQVRCKVTWDRPLDKALDGADAVSVVLMAGPRDLHAAGEAACRHRGFVGSDNLSPAGTLLAMKAAPILMDLAARMKRRCPDAWLLEFANPVAILSSLLNSHTPIKAMGICAGYTNHQWDIARVLGEDVQRHDIDVQVAGINHMSFILHGTVGKADLFATLKRRLSQPGWKPPRLGSWWPAGMKPMITRSVLSLAKIYRELGLLVFSTEGDGLANVLGEAWCPPGAGAPPAESLAAVRKGMKRSMQGRAAGDLRFRELLGRELDAHFWAEHWRTDGVFRREDDIFVEILRGIAKVRPVKIATSRPNGNAVIGMPENGVLEYSQILHGQTIRPAERCAIPALAQGLVSAWSAHQTLVADALAAQDPRLLAQACMAYPMHPFSGDTRAMFRQLIKLNAPALPGFARESAAYL